MFFSEIAQKLGNKATSINTNITFKGDQLIVMVSPTFSPEAVKEQPALASPFVVQATAAELDAGFVGAFDQFVVTINTLADQAQKQIEAIKAKAAKTTTVKPAGKSSTATSDELASIIGSGSSATDDDDDESESGGTESAVAATTATAPANPNESLFD